MPKIAAFSLEDKTLADGAETIATGADDGFPFHALRVQVDAAPSAGTLAVAVRIPGATEFDTLATLDLTSPTGLRWNHSGFVAEWKFTPAGIVPAGTKWSAYIVAGMGAPA